MKYRVALRKHDEGYSVSCPSLPGCWSQGRTEQEALANIQGAIEDYLLAINDTVRGAEIREVEVMI